MTLYLINKAISAKITSRRSSIYPADSGSTTVGQQISTFEHTDYCNPIAHAQGVSHGSFPGKGKVL